MPEQVLILHGAGLNPDSPDFDGGLLTLCMTASRRLLCFFIINPVVKKNRRGSGRLFPDFIR